MDLKFSVSFLKVCLDGRMSQISHLGPGWFFMFVFYVYFVSFFYIKSSSFHNTKTRASIKIF